MMFDLGFVILLLFLGVLSALAASLPSLSLSAFFPRSAKSREADFSERDKLILPASVAASSDHLHMHVANSIEELQAFWNSGHVSVLYFKPEGKLYLSDNIPTFEADEFDRKGLLAKLNGSPELFWEDFLFTS